MTVVQRFDSALRLNVHFHTLVLERALAILKLRGRSLDVDDDSDALGDKEPLLARCYSAAVEGVALLGADEGAPPGQITRPTEIKEELVADVKGLSR